MENRRPAIATPPNALVQSVVQTHSFLSCLGDLYGFKWSPESSNQGKIARRGSFDIVDDVAAFVSKLRSGRKQCGDPHMFLWRVPARSGMHIKVLTHETVTAMARPIDGATT